ncbi:MAG: SDR family NAD(P)-dependent oxidoreductase [Spirochaetota bacterium]
MDLELDGRTAWVSGGSRGIGKAIALELAREGVRVAISGRTEADLEAAAEEVGAATGRRPVVARGDTRVTEEVASMADAIRSELGTIDILVNCAAQPGGYVHTLGEGAHVLLGQDLDTKVLGYLRCIEAVVPLMQASHWGRIINVGGLAARSSSSLSGVRNLALVHLGKSLSDQLGRDGITVNTVHPGATRTGRTTDDDARRVGGENAIGRIVDAREIGWLVAFLCSPKATAITGESIGAGGGVGHSVHP